MSTIRDYYHKKQLLEQLSSELQKLEDDQSLKSALEFEEEVKSLMDKHGMSPRDVLQILTVLDPSIAAPATGSGRAKRALITYTNPHTGEVVKTRGGNHKKLREWREQYGTDAVASWKQD